MSFSRSIVALSLLSVAATAHAGFTAALPEPTTVTLIFVAMAVIGLVIGRRKPEPIEA